MAAINANVNSSLGWLPLTMVDALSLAPGYYTIDSENVDVGGLHFTGTRTTTAPNGRWAVRGFAASTAASHLSGATLTRYYPEAPAAPGGGALTFDNTVDPPEEVTEIVAPGAVIAGGVATLSGVPDPSTGAVGDVPQVNAGQDAYELAPATTKDFYAQDDDPGAVGAGSVWKDTSDGVGAASTWWERNTDNDGWLPGIAILAVGDGWDSGFVIDPDTGEFSIRVGNVTVLFGVDGAVSISQSGALNLTKASITFGLDGSVVIGANAGNSTVTLAANGSVEFNGAGVIFIDPFGQLPSTDPEVRGQLYTDGVVSAGVPQPLMVSGGAA